MNEKIRSEIIKLFANHASRSLDWLVSEIRKIGIIGEDGKEVVRTLGFMKDRGEVEELGIGVYRLTLGTINAEEPWYSKTWKYLLENWIAIAALIIALVK